MTDYTVRYRGPGDVHSRANPVSDDAYDHYYFLISPGFNDARQERLAGTISALGRMSNCEIVDYSGVATGVTVTHTDPNRLFRLMPHQVLGAIAQCIGNSNYQVIQMQPGRAD